jgi:hypothetical protein
MKRIPMLTCAALLLVPLATLNLTREGITTTRPSPS